MMPTFLLYRMFMLRMKIVELSEAQPIQRQKKVLLVVPNGSSSVESMN